MKTVQFAKWQGLGNDYLIVEAGELPSLDPATVGRLCDRHFGIGADGILVHEKPSGAVPGAVARMRIFNPDGSEPEMCGNGIRMFARYLHQRGLAPEGEFIVETLAGPIAPRLLPDGRVRVKMGRARFQSDAIRGGGFEQLDEIVQRRLTVAGQEITFTFVDVGNPHCIIQADDLATVPLERLGPEIETSPLFPRRVNVEFIRAEEDGSVSMRVWERGVGETMACGTGGTAVGAAAVRLGLAQSPVTVHLLGGDLEIEVGEGWDVTMTGPAEEVFTGSLSEDLLTRLKQTQHP